MQYAITQKKLGMVLTGDCGVGKTFVSKVLMNLFFDGQCKFIYIANTLLTPVEFLQELNFQLEGTSVLGSNATKPEILRSIKERLEFYQKQNLYVVMIVDDAQSIPDDNLVEEIRLLLNIHENETVMFTLILSGQKSLTDKIEQNPALRQRLSIRYELGPLDISETIQYIEHRLEVTGIRKKIFTLGAYNAIHTLSGGKPRVINNICDFALLSGYMRKINILDEEIIKHVAVELGETGDSHLSQ
jgi:type II secretory pathway predicted ATPase ExeA